MKIETTKMSSRGQIVIPQNVRAEINAEEGTIFLVMTSGDTLVLKKVETPSKEVFLKEFKDLVTANTKRNEKLGIKESDVPDMIHRLRASKRKR